MKKHGRKPVAVEWQGRLTTYDELAREYGICRSTLNGRLREGWSLERSLTTPVRKWAGIEHGAEMQPRENALPDVDAALERAVQFELAPPWERHPQPIDPRDVVYRPAPGTAERSGIYTSASGGGA